MAVWETFRINIPAHYMRPNIYRDISRSMSRKLTYINQIETAIEQGWLDELPPRRNSRARVFVLYLQDGKTYGDIPVTFNLKKDGQLLEI